MFIATKLCLNFFKKLKRKKHDDVTTFSLVIIKSKENNVYIQSESISVKLFV